MLKLRAPLFAPGDSERKSAKALASAADSVILDLEDSVAATGKDAARAATAAVVRGAPRGRGVIVRVNPRGTPWYAQDVALMASCAPDAIMLPKCAGADDVAVLADQLDVLEAQAGLPVGAIGIVPIATETAASVFTLASYAACGPRLLALCFGAEDLAGDMGIAPRVAGGSYVAPVAWARAALLVAAAAAGVPAIDTPHTDPRDADGLAREAARAASDGFAGKLLIHPDQIGPVVAAFTPSPERVEWAQRVRDGFAAQPHAGVFTLDGKMIDRPHLRLAERILAAAG